MKTLAWLALILAFIGGCTNGAKPCQTSNECGTDEVCAAARCQALSCDDTWYATDPGDGTCRPLPACGNKEEVRAWVSCADPCQGVDENTCIADKRCQPAYATDENTVSPQPCAEGDFQPGPGGGCGLPPSRRTFVGCHANPLPDDPCAGLDETACKADARCVAEQLAIDVDCACVTEPCDCPVPGPSFECRVKTCGDYSDAKECEAHPECTDNPAQTGVASTGGAPAPSPNVPVPPPPVDAGTGFGGCFNKFFGCSGMDEATCLRHSECHAVGTDCYCPDGTSCACSGGRFLFCEADDGLHRCNSDSDCGGDQRCSNDDDVCAPPVGGGGGGVIPVDDTAGAGATSGLGTRSEPVPPTKCAGLCVPKGCPGYGEAHCVADPTCQPIYSLNCTPYGGGCGFGGDAPPNAGAEGAPAFCDPSTCEPTFAGCTDHPLPEGVDADKTVLIREPVVVDDPAFAFAQVMTALAGGKDPAPLVTAWLNQLTEAQTVNGRTANARTGATAFLSTLPRRPDGLLDVGRLGFQTTSLSNRIDLAGPNDCGEARVTFALSTGIADRRHRMTVIVELKQPDDGQGCQTVAKKWLALGALSGADLATALKAIYTPMLTPARLGQVRTNEFLVGPASSPDPSQNEPWELREWRLGTDGLLHLAPSKQAVDAQAALTDAFSTWAHANAAGILAGSAVVPDTFLAVTSSENGQRITLQQTQANDWQIQDALNQQACAGCHTTEFHTAFAHVAERFGGTGRAEISEFLRKELSKRAINLLRAAGGLTRIERLTPKPVH